MKAGEIMTANPKVITPDRPIGEAAAIMADRDVGMIPVVDSHDSLRLEGVITDRDIAIRHAARGHGPECMVRDHMTKGKLCTVRADDHVHDVIGRMEHDQVRRMLVVDGDHRLVGVIALADIARHAGPAEPKLVEELLEEVSTHIRPLVIA